MIDVQQIPDGEQVTCDATFTSGPYAGSWCYAPATAQMTDYDTETLRVLCDEHLAEVTAR